MKTIAEVTRAYVAHNPVFKIAISSDLINIRKAANQIRPWIEEEIGAKVGTDTVAMALRREIPIESKVDRLNFFLALPSVTIKGTIHNITAHTYRRGHSGGEYIPDPTRFFVQTTGANEHTIIISQEDDHLLNEQGRISSLNNLSAICLGLEENSIYHEAIYAKIFLAMAAEGVSIVEVVSTCNELTIVINSKDFLKIFTMFENTTK